MRRALPLLLLLGSILGAGCDDPEPSAPPAEIADEEAREPTEDAPEAPARPARTRYNLAAHFERAELFRGETRVIQLGEPAGHQHTLGGWRTRTGETHDFDGTRAAVVGSETGFFVVPIDAPGRCRITLRARAFADGRLAVYLDDETIGNVTVPTGDGWETVHAQVPEALCTPGEHELRLRVARAGSVPGVGRAGVAVDWVAIGPSAGEAAVAPIDPRATIDGAPGLEIADGWTVAYSFEVPAGARLRGLVRGPGRVEARLARDQGSTIALDPLEAPRFDLDLSSAAGEIVRLELRAQGDVTLVRPAVVTLDAEPARPARQVRNVLFYLTDTLRADHLTVYAPDTRVQTPGLGAWAEEAAVFTASHAQENWTKPSCATLLSGLYPWEHHATGEDSSVPASVQLVSETLGERGFRTGAFVTNGFVSDRFGFDQGWDRFFNYIRRGRRNMARYVAEDVLAWLDEQPEDQPFFLYVHTIDPHVPYIPPDEDLARYDPEPYEGVVDFTQDRELLEKVKSGRIDLSARDRVHLEALYDGEVTYHDRYFAEIIEGLEARGLADDTLVVFTSDHGEEFWDHGSVGHGHSVWEELIRVPLIVRWPGVTDGGARIEEAVGLVDLVPTALEALGAEVPRSLSGRSLAPLLRGLPEDAPRPVVTGFMNGWRTVVVGRYKLIQRTPSRFMLYDLAEDPDETTDLAEERPLAVRYLRGLLGLTLAGATGRAHTAERAEIDATLRTQLEALGYVGASRPGARGEPEEAAGTGD